MSDEVTALGADRASGLGTRIALGGREYTLSPLTVDDLAELQAWVYSQLPDPIKVARELAEGLPADIAEHILLTAYEDVKNGARRLGSPEANQALRSIPGWREMLFLHGRRRHPEMTRADWERVLLDALAEDLEAIGAQLAEQEGGALPDPKAPSSSAPTGGPSTSGTSTTSAPPATAGGPTSSAA